MTETQLFQHSILFETPKRIVPPFSWTGHIPFAFFLIDQLRPTLFVELGVHTGNSYNAFCQAVKTLSTQTTCYGVDTWQGDEHAGFYPESIYLDLAAYQQQEYAEFSQLMRMTFDEALAYFADQTIDLLHIDGCHRYGDVRYDFEAWLPKISDKGLVLFHDTQMRRDQFGVWRLWEELSAQYPSFEFRHSYGLGVLAIGKKVDQTFLDLLQEFSTTPYYHNVFGRLGETITLTAEKTELTDTLRQKEALLDQLTPHYAAQLFVDTGLGFNEQQSLTQTIKGDERVVEFDLSSYGGIKQLRFDPVNAVAVLHLYDLRVVTHKGTAYPITEYQTNAYYQSGQSFVFNTPNPNLVFVSPVKRIHKVVIGLQYAAIGQGAYQQIFDLDKILLQQRDQTIHQQVQALQMKDAELAQQAQVLQQHEQTIQQQAQTTQAKDAGIEDALFALKTKETEHRHTTQIIQQMEETLSWKVTTPLRTLRNLKLFNNQWSYHEASWKGKVLRFCAKRLWPKRLIRQSGLFDQDHYLQNNPDVAQAGVNPLRHFLRHGGFEGRKPNPFFDSAYYLQRNDDVKHTGLNPLLHYILYGEHEGRKPCAEFDPSYYLEHNPDVTQVGISPLTHYLRYGRQEGHVKERCENRGQTLHSSVSSGINENTSNPNIAIEQIKLHSFLQTPDFLVFPEYEQPVLSIILVLFNRSELTFQCLESVKAHADVPYEIVIVDNASSDQTASLLKKLKNVNIIVNNGNIGFLKACNQAVVSARGTYVLLLNNDTQLLPSTLSNLVLTMESDPKIGVVGGKLIFPNGKLQEAGSIIWKDGSCLGYGRNDDPYKPEYSYLREVYYCSGALFLTPRQLFLDVGKFDEAYYPAYFEEADYCMKIREKGYKVIYQPCAQIIHHEFASSKKSEEAIQLQITNREKFRQKWSTRLADYYEPNEENILWTREYTLRKQTKRILFIDDRIPEPTLGSGYQRSLDMIHALVELGYQVMVLPLQFPDKLEPLTHNLQQKGVEVLYNHRDVNAKLSLRALLKSRPNYYDQILVSRPHNMKEVLFERDVITNQTKIIYDCEALFAEREILYRELIRDPVDDAEKDRLIRQEVDIGKQAHAAITVSQNEKRLFEQYGIHHLNVVGYSIETHPTTASFEERQDILFVGAIHHFPSPNEDAILYFANEIYPEVAQKTGANLFIVGINTSKKVWNLHSDHIQVLGKVEQLVEYYQRCRVFVVPTRYAAGIPYKLHEASAYGVPAVVTPLIAKQVGWQDGESLLIGHDAHDFAQKCVKLYTEKVLWETIRKNALKMVAQDCSPQVFKENLRHAIEDALTEERYESQNKSNADADIEKIKTHWGEEDAWSVGRGLHWLEHVAVQERINRKVSGDSHQNMWQFLMQFLERHDKSLPLERCLTLGCGTGDLERGLAQYNFCQRHDAYDIADSAIQKAIERANAANFTHIFYSVADLNQAVLESNTYDLVFGMSSIHHIHNLEHIFYEVHKSLKSQGLFFLNEFVGPTQFQWTNKQLEQVNHLLQSLPEKYRIMRDGTVKQRCERPTLEQMDADPSEAVRSGDILKVLPLYFDIVEQKDFGGTILHLLLEGIAYNFDVQNAHDMQELHRLFKAEDALLESGELSSDFTVIIAVKK